MYLGMMNLDYDGIYWYFQLSEIKLAQELSEFNLVRKLIIETFYFKVNLFLIMSKNFEFPILIIFCLLSSVELIVFILVKTTRDFLTILIASPVNQQSHQRHVEVQWFKLLAWLKKLKLQKRIIIRVKVYKSLNVIVVVCYG